MNSLIFLYALFEFVHAHDDKNCKQQDDHGVFIFVLLVIIAYLFQQQQNIRRQLAEGDVEDSSDEDESDADDEEEYEESEAEDEEQEEEDIEGEDADEEEQSEPEAVEENDESEEKPVVRRRSTRKGKTLGGAEY